MLMMLFPYSLFDSVNAYQKYQLEQNRNGIKYFKGRQSRNEYVVGSFLGSLYRDIAKIFSLRKYFGKQLCKSGIGLALDVIGG